MSGDKEETARFRLNAPAIPAVQSPPAGTGKPARKPRQETDGHAIRVAQPWAWQYSTGGDCCKFCLSNPMGVYLGPVFKAVLPHVKGRTLIGRGRKSERHYILSATEDSPPRMVSTQQVKSGEWASLLDMPGSADDTIIRVCAQAITQIAYADGTPIFRATPHRSDRTPDGFMPIPAPEVLPDGYMETPGNSPEAQRGALISLARIIAACPKIALSYGASVGSPFVCTSVDGQSHAWDMYGAVRQGKTSASQACASVWGDPEIQAHGGILLQSNATVLGMARKMGEIGNLPAFWEEFVETPEKRRDLLLNLLNGNTRTQSQRNGPGAIVLPGWSGVVFFTGNSRALDDVGGGAYAGLHVRVIEIEAPFTNDAAQAKDIKRLVNQCFGIVGPAVMRSVTPEVFQETVSDAMRAMNAPDGGANETLAQHYGHAVAGAMFADRVISEITGENPHIADSAIAEATERIRALMEPKSDGTLMLEMLAEFMASEPSAWPWQAQYEYGGSVAGGPIKGRVSGLRDSEYVYVFPHAWQAIADKAGADKGIAQAELYGAGVLTVPEKRRANGEWQAPAPRWAGSARCYKVRAEYLAAPGEDDGPQEPASEPGPAVTPPAVRQAASEPHAATLEPAEPAPGDVPGRQAAAVRDAIDRKAVRTDAQAAELLRVIRVIDSPGENEGERAKTIRFLDALEGTSKKVSGPFAPFRDRKPPYWHPADMPDHIIDAVIPSDSWGWSRNYRGRTVDLDRNAAWPTATASVRIAHGPLVHTGEIELSPGEIAPGLYRMRAYPWNETGMPSPFPGRATPGEDYWITSPVAELLRDLHAAGRWPDNVASDSYTGIPARLDEWAHLIREARAYALTYYGRDSDQYADVKQAFGFAASLMRGAPAEGNSLRRVHRSKNNRTDWALSIAAQAAVTIWRIADRTGCAVGLTAIDTLTIPQKELARLTSGDNPVIRLDPSGVTLGTFKIKGDDE